MSKLAIHGGQPIRTRSFPDWPVFGECERKALLRVLESRAWWRFGTWMGGVQGGPVWEFEDRFAAYHDAKYGIAVANGTAALEVALKAGGISFGDEVIVPPYTFLSTASAVLQVNAVPIFADVDTDTYCLDPEAVEETITERTKAIIPVHYGGYPSDMDALLSISKKYDLLLIEDAAHAHGAVWQDKKVGAIGAMGTFSFQMSKNMTSGEGGIILTNDKELAAKCYSLSNFGRVEGRPKYEYHYLGWNYRMTSFQAAILLCQLERVEEQTEQRLINAKYLNKRLHGIEGIKIMKDDDPRVARRAYHIYTFKYIKEASGGVPRERFIEALRAEGIPASTGYNIPLYRNPIFLEHNFWTKGHRGNTEHPAVGVDYSRVHCPVSEKAMCHETIMLDQNVLLGTTEDMEDVIKAILKVMENKERLRE